MIKNPRVPITVKFDLQDLEIMGKLTQDRIFLNNSDVIREFFKLGYFIYSKKQEVVNPEFQEMVKTKVDRNDFITTMREMEKNDPKMFRAIADYFGYGLAQETYQKKFD